MLSRNNMKTNFVILALIMLFATGCSSIGPTMVTQDRFNYNQAISDSWKEQTLLNIVKIRYADMPVFVEVSSIVGGYTLERAVDFGGAATSSRSLTGDFFTFGASGTFVDRPTITYVPITGQKFNASFMTPIPPRAILFLLQSGWPADTIFPITVDSINGMRAQIAAGSSQRLGDIDYYRVVNLLRKVQNSGAVGMRIQKMKAAADETVLYFYKGDIDQDVETALIELRMLLGLRPGLREYKISYGLIAKGDTEIAILTRSMLQIMIDLATQVEVPDEDIASGRTVPSLTIADGNQNDPRRTIRIHHSAERPENAFSAVNYRNQWFWIDDRDFKSKRVFAFVMILFSLSETGGNEGLPLVTIPAG
jgi:hypothetical protein